MSRQIEEQAILQIDDYYYTTAALTPVSIP